MYLHDSADYIARAGTLIAQLVNDHDPKYGVGSLSCSVYDTAWVAMVIKNANGQKRWLFPSSFEYLINQQQHDGGWRTFSDADGILNTLAALLAYCQHLRYPLQLTPSEDLGLRRDRAIYFLETQFAKCDVESIVTPTSQPFFSRLLQMLEQEDIHFSFPGKDSLVHERGRKMPNRSLAVLYGTARTSGSHHLESQIGEIDFDRVGQHKICGSVMASPAATAAYLMNCTSWDDEAEAYLHHIVSIGDSKSVGGVPSKFPTTVFEVTQVISTLLENGFTPENLGAQALDNAATFLHDCLQLESGVTGFAPYLDADAGNTAQAISALCLLGRSVSPQGLIDRFETRENFKTYTPDRNPSFSTNCLVLQSLLDSLPGNTQQMPQIEKCIRFICSVWWTTNDQIEDQSNTSPSYPTMLMTKTFMRLIQLWEQGFVPVPNDPSIRDRVIISLFQALSRTLQSQNRDGSWGNDSRCETTAYAVITLTKLASLSSAPRVKIQCTLAINNGRNYLSNNYLPFSEPELVWMGKTTYGCRILYQAYILAALQAPVPKQSGPTVESHFEISLAKVTIQTKYYGRQSWFASTPEWLIQASLVEGYLFLPQIRDVRYAIFSNDTLAEDQHFDYIPFVWICANNIEKKLIGAEYLYQMMILSMLNRQFEDYRVNVVAETFAGCMFEIEDIIQSVFQELEMYSKDQCYCADHNVDTSRTSTATTISDVRSILYRFISHILNHPYVLMASIHDQAQLICELQSYLHSRVSQVSNGGHAEGERSDKAPTDQTAHPYTFAFLTCIVGNQGLGSSVGLRKDFLETAEQKFLAADLIRHVSILNFMSSNADNQQTTAPPRQVRKREMSFDGSQQSFDRSVSCASTASSYYGEEGFSPVSPVSSVSSTSIDSPKASKFPWRSYSPSSQMTSATSEHSSQLGRLLSHERRSLRLCLDSLEEAGVSRATANIVKLFAESSELSGQIYNDLNIGSCFQPTTAHEVIDQACILSPPTRPSKQEPQKGSVSAARAAINVPPLKLKQEHRPRSLNEGAVIPPETVPPLPAKNSSRASSFDHGHDRTLMSKRKESPVNTVPMERDWSWNKPIMPKRRMSRASVEVSRIEQIMTDMESINIGSKQSLENGKCASNEHNAAWVQQKPKIDAQKRLADFDAETIKLSKARLESQRHQSVQPKSRSATDLHNKAKGVSVVKAKTAIEVQKKDETETNKQDVKRRATEPAADGGGGWIKSPPSAEVIESREVQARKLHRASRLGGPRWKAPF